MRQSEAFVLLCGVVLCTSSCDCENRIRRAISDRGTRHTTKSRLGEAQIKKLSSAPTEQEPNEHWGSATKLNIDGELRSVLGEIGGQRDVDRFALSFKGEGALIELTLEPKSKAGDLVLELAMHAGAKEDVVLYDLGAAGEQEVVAVLAATRGPVFLGVRSKSGALKVPYALRFKRRLSGGAIEAEPNDVPSHAWMFQAPGEIQGFYDRPKDRDFFKLERPGNTQEAVYSLSVSAVPDVEQQVDVFDHKDAVRPFVSFSVSSTHSSKVPNLRLPAGAGALWVSLTAKGGAYNTKKPYRMRFLELPKPGSVWLESEPNDLPEQAVVLHKAQIVWGYLHHAQDVDHFELVLGDVHDGVHDANSLLEHKLAQDATDEPTKGQDLGPSRRLDVDELLKDVVRDPKNAKEALRPKPVIEARAQTDSFEHTLSMPQVQFAPLVEKRAPKHVVELTVTPAHKDELLRLEWSGRAGLDDVHRASAPFPGSPISLCRMGLKDGRYAFSIHSVERKTKVSGATEPDYKIEVVERATKKGVEVEPNNTTDRADRLSFDAPGRGAIQAPADADFYAFDLEGVQGQVHKIEFSLDPHPLNLNFKILDDEGGLIAQVHDSGPGGGESRVADLPSGRYFIEVSAQEGDSCVGYILRVAPKKTNL